MILAIDLFDDDGNSVTCLLIQVSLFHLIYDVVREASAQRDGIFIIIGIVVAPKVDVSVGDILFRLLHLYQEEGFK